MEFTSLASGESCSIKLPSHHHYYISYHKTYQGQSCLQSFDLTAKVTFWVKTETSAEAEYCECSSENTLSLEIDYSSVEQLPTPKGEPSWYIRYLDHICCIIQLSVYPNARKIKINQDKARVLSDIYIVDDEKVFREGSKISASAKNFKVFNRLFAGNDEEIITTYGKGKIKDPKSFEAFGVYPRHYDDDEDQDEEDGYCHGYGRDKYHLYYYTENTNTPHALIVRSCKNPASFQELMVKKSGTSDLYGRCADNVYIENAKIDGADPETWQYMGLYSKDHKRGYFSTRKITGVDLATFEVIEDTNNGFFMDPGYDNLENSRWAKDKNHYYLYGKRKTLADYEEDKRWFLENMDDDDEDEDDDD